ncbi:quinoprotein relay system zinc metallohydrolase 1 [Neptuniibacter sp. QD34_54]|uniref:quinoprotein relay system zinc metallohydrolase 1 n=1 Tax=Neptuniibacter sp. QD34_54 TaxID=3398208 RepID=UPI0039F5F9BB
MKRLLLALSAAAVIHSASAAPLSYDLKPQKIADNTWLLKGKLEDFSKSNGGNIVNTGFIVTEDGVVVIDTGPSLRYGKALKAAIESVTNKPIKVVFNTHHHPDHFLGNQAFADAEILSLPGTQQGIELHGNAFAENMYRLVGDWMRSTEAIPPSKILDVQLMELGSHRLHLLPFTGHTGSDLVVMDEKTGVVFASDMVFYQRALTTPHTPGIHQWKKEILKLKDLDYKVMVPGHGPVVTDARALDQMLAYLDWLDRVLVRAAQDGLSMTEVIKLPIPKDFDGIALSKREFARTVAHLYPKYEEQAF